MTAPARQRKTGKRRIAAALAAAAVLLAVLVAVAIRARGRPAVAPEAAQGAGDAQSTLHRAPVPTAASPAGIPIASAVADACRDEGQADDGLGAGAEGRQVPSQLAGVAARWLSALQASGDLRARVAGLLLEGKIGYGKPPQPDSEQARNEVIQLAAGSVDPAVYAMALSMCDPDAVRNNASACRNLSVRRWAELDPGNAVPWLLVAGEAMRRSDGGSANEAFEHAASANSADGYGTSIYSFAEVDLPHDTTPMQRAQLAVQVMGVDAAAPAGEFRIALDHCSAGNPRDAVVQRQCLSLAELFATKGVTLMDLAIGRAIGKGAGWPSARVSRLELEQYALMEAIGQAAWFGDDEQPGCDGANRVNAYMASRARLGEVGAARELLDRSGETVEAMAERHVQRMDRQRKAAEGGSLVSPEEPAAR